MENNVYKTETTREQLPLLRCISSVMIPGRKFSLAYGDIYTVQYRYRTAGISHRSLLSVPFALFLIISNTTNYIL